MPPPTRNETIVGRACRALALVDGNRVEFGTRLDECQRILDRADRLARASAGEMIAYADEPFERYLLLRYNRNVIASIEEARRVLAGALAFAG